MQNIGNIFVLFVFVRKFETIIFDFSREATPTSELYGDSEHVLSTSKRKSTPPPTTLRRKNPKPAAENMPSPAELEAFFAAAEKYEHKRFAEK